MANSETSKTIILQLNERFSERPLDEAQVKASNSITPGMVIAFDGDDVVPAAAGPTYPMVAVENPYLTPTYGSGKAIDTAYGNGDPEPCRYFIPQRGDMAYCLLDASENVGRGDLLVVSVTTNGTILTPAILQMLRDERIRLCVSLDGTQAVHDRYRRRRDGGPTDDRIVRNLGLAMDVLDDVQVNAVFSPATIDQLAAGVASILELGVAVVHVNPDICAAWTDEAAHTARQQFADIARLYIDSFAAGKEIGINIIDSKVIVLLKSGYSRLDRCGMARTQWAVAPGGNLYPCERFIGDDRDSPFCLGNVHTGLDMERQSRIRRGVGNRNPECAACPLGPYCMNWCGCTNFYLSGATDRTGRAQCIFERAAIAAARTVLTELSVSGNELFIDHFMGYLNHQRLPAVVGNL